MPEWAVGIIGAIVGASGGLTTAFLTRRNSLEARMAHIENQNRALWLYTRQLIDHIYQQLPPPPPEPPKTVVDMEGN